MGTPEKGCAGSVIDSSPSPTLPRLGRSLAFFSFSCQTTDNSCKRVNRESEATLISWNDHRSNAFRFYYSRRLLALSPHHYRLPSQAGSPFCVSLIARTHFSTQASALQSAREPRANQDFNFVLPNYAAVSDQIDGISRDPPRVAQPKDRISPVTTRTRDSSSAVAQFCAVPYPFVWTPKRFPTNSLDFIIIHQSRN